jgi:hypothetical protein
MKDLIKALTIFAKYTDSKYPTHCEHDILTITSDVDANKVSDEDKLLLAELGFEVESNLFVSYRYGSC